MIHKLQWLRNHYACMLGYHFAIGNHTVCRQYACHQPHTYCHIQPHSYSFANAAGMWHT
jgi:hypothetical protein